MLFVLDNYDSFTYNLVQYLGELGARMKVARNNKISVDEVERLEPEGIVISQGRAPRTTPASPSTSSDASTRARPSSACASATRPSARPSGARCRGRRSRCTARRQASIMTA